MRLKERGRKRDNGTERERKRYSVTEKEEASWSKIAILRF